MDHLLQTVKIDINDKIYLKDPQSSDLGKRIIEQGINMIFEMGFDKFTFKKLGDKIGSNESSIYRYFESKHKLLLYLASWYWGWLEYKLVFATNGISNAEEKLKKALEIITSATEEDSSISHVNEVLLNKIVINEYSKSYLTKEVDAENKEGYFVIFKRLVKRISDMIVSVDPTYHYPSSLASTIVEGALHQYFLKEHFSSMTDCNDAITPTQFLTDLVFNSLNLGTNE
ncbi:MAG: TetR/AcrR family transcriptional regulator [Flavobacteriales bacterium]|nr:MAG: TetR/AcrR family transcriptional regulator [Flavobacteriales bacterium]